METEAGAGRLTHTGRMTRSTADARLADMRQVFGHQADL